MAKLYELPKQENPFRQDVKRILQESLELEADACVVLLLTTDGQALVKSSGTDDMLRLLGCLETAKHTLLESWD